MATMAQRLAKRELLKEVTLSTGLRLRLRSLNSQSLAERGVAALLVAVGEGARPGRKAGKRPTEAVAADPVALGKALSLQAGLVTAGVAEAYNDESGAWEPLIVVADGVPADPARNELHLSDLSGEEQGEIVGHVLQLSGARGALADAVARFQSGGN